MEFIGTDDLQKFANHLMEHHLFKLCVGDKFSLPDDIPSRRVDKVAVIGKSLVVKTSFPGLPDPVVQEVTFEPGRHVFLLNPQQSWVYDTKASSFWTFRQMLQPRIGP